MKKSEECLEKDKHGRSLFCYSNSSIIDSNLPVDCANYTVTELKELAFQCYAIAVPGLGIAAAAALGLAKVAIVVVTIYVEVTEGIFMLTKNAILYNPPQKLQDFLYGHNKLLIIICVDVIYIILNIFPPYCIIISSCFRSKVH